MDLVDNAVDGFLTHELMAVRRAEQRLASQLANTTKEVDRWAIVRAMSFLEQRLDTLETVLDELNRTRPPYSVDPGMPLCAA